MLLNPTRSRSFARPVPGSRPGCCRSPPPAGGRGTFFTSAVRRTQASRLRRALGRAASRVAGGRSAHDGAGSPAGRLKPDTTTVGPEDAIGQSQLGAPRQQSMTTDDLAAEVLTPDPGRRKQGRSMAGEDDQAKKTRATDRRAAEARSARRAHGALHRPGAGALRLCVDQAAPAPAGESGGGVRDAGRRGRPAGNQRRDPRRRRAGPGAGRGDAPHPGPALPRGLRHLDGVQPAAGRQHAQAVQARSERLRRLPRDARQGTGDRRGHHRHARLLARAAHDRLPQGRQARVLREGDVEYARGRAQHGGRRPGDRQAAPDRAPAPLESTLPALLSEAAGGSEAARTDRDRQRSVEPCGRRRISALPIATRSRRRA